MGLNNDLVVEHMNALFGEERAKQLRKELVSLDPEEREFVIVEELCIALQQNGQRFILPFRFRSQSGRRTSHHLIFVSKSFKGYEIMKEIMANLSSDNEQGVPSFEYNPAKKRQPLLFEFSRPIDELEQLILTQYAGKTLTMKQIYCDHNVGKRYIKRNYKEALLKLESEGKIITSPANRKKGFGDNVLVTFPAPDNLTSEEH
jgi:hypothetical protein